MPMVPFFEKFGDLAFKEMRVATIPAGNPAPADEYGFVEFYCNDKSCDCRRVIIRVMGRLSGDKVWATISFGWEDAAFYRKWSPGIDSAPEWSHPTLDPLNPQSEHAESFLALFEQMVQDKNYVRRIETHYKMFRKP